MCRNLQNSTDVLIINLSNRLKYPSIDLLQCVASTAIERISNRSTRCTLIRAITTYLCVPLTYSWPSFLKLSTDTLYNILPES